MRAFDFTLLAVLSYVVVIGATPLEARAPAEAVVCHPLMSFSQFKNGKLRGSVLTRPNFFSPAQIAYSTGGPEQSAMAILPTQSVWDFVSKIISTVLILPGGLAGLRSGKLAVLPADVL
jgi:hypothetical protein